MMQASYKLVKYIPDLARQEPLNIGILAWCQGQSVLVFDAHAFHRITTANGDLADDALKFITDAIVEEYNDARLRDGQDIDAFVREALSTPFLVTEERPFGIADAPVSGVKATLANETERLMERLVKPQRRRSKQPSKGPKATLVSEYRRFLQPDQLQQSFEITATKTGHRRKVDLFINHHVDAVVDVLDIRSDATYDTAEIATDAMRSKSEDILDGNAANVVIVHLAVDMRHQLGDFVPLARTLLRGVQGVRLTTSINENVGMVQELTQA